MHQEKKNENRNLKYFYASLLLCTQTISASWCFMPCITLGGWLTWAWS